MVVVGRGRVGTSLVRAFRAAGLRATAVPGRGPLAIPSGATLVVVAVPDRAVAEVARGLARRGVPAGAAVVHASGALSIDALSAVGANPIGSFHPLQSFPVPRDPAAFSGITVGIEASTAPLRRRLFALARSIGARPRRVPDRDRVIYHAAGVFASNYVDAAFSEGIRLLEAIGWTSKESTAALLPLLDGAVGSIHSRGAALALTGPIRRGDAETVRRHLEALRELDRRTRSRSGPAIEAVYRMLGSIALSLALQAGLEPAAARRLRRALTRQVAATRRRGRK